MSLVAGAACRPMRLPAGLPMGGYGARVGAAEGIHDDLCVRTFTLSDGNTTLALAVCDLVAVSDDIVARTRELAGLPSGHVCVAATHTHSGPGVLRLKDGPEVVEQVAEAAAASISDAVAAARPVSLKVAPISVGTVGRNRRAVDGPFEDGGLVLVGDGGTAEPPVATLVNFACHATVLEYDNLLYSGDFPAAAARLVEANGGGRCIYVQGACGDVNPVWMRHDFAEASRVGGIVGAAALRAVHEARPAGARQSVINLTLDRAVDVEAAAEELKTVPLAAASRRIQLPRPGKPPLGCELQTFRLAEGCVVLALPGEFFVSTARAIRDRAGVRHLVVACYANGYIGYVVPPGEYPKGGYEVRVARTSPAAEAAVIDEAVALIEEVVDARA